MLWVKEYPFNMPDYFQDVCREFLENNEPEDSNQYESVQDSKMWLIWNHNRYHSPKLVDIRKQILETTGANLEYDKGFTAIWRYDENFPQCPIHIDGAGYNDKGEPGERKHNGSICTSLTGTFKLHLHHQDTEEIVETVEITDKKLVVLNNTVYPHSVQGQGDLIVFGIDLQSDPEEFFAGESPNVRLV